MLRCFPVLPPCIPAAGVGPSTSPLVCVVQGAVPGAGGDGCGGRTRMDLGKVLRRVTQGLYVPPLRLALPAWVSGHPPPAASLQFGDTTPWFCRQVRCAARCRRPPREAGWEEGLAKVRGSAGLGGCVCVAALHDGAHPRGDVCMGAVEHCARLPRRRLRADGGGACATPMWGWGAAQKELE